MKDAKQFYKETGLSKDTTIFAIDIYWLVGYYYGEDIDLANLLTQAIRDGEVETVGDSIQYMNDYY